MFDEVFGKCPYVTVQKIFSGKWSILILYRLSRQTYRFGELQRALYDITQSTLTKQLRSLEEYGLINRKVHHEIPPKVEYSLSKMGQEFIPVLEQFEVFGKKYIDSM